MKVLIVDDDPNLRALYADALARAGCEVRVACDAAAGIAALSNGRYEILLLDVRLGRDHGLDVAREVGRLGLSTRIAVVCGTSDLTRSEVFEISPRVAAVMRKPVDIEQLVSGLQAAAEGELSALRADGVARAG